MLPAVSQKYRDIITYQTHKKRIQMYLYIIYLLLPYFTDYKAHFDF